MAADQMYGRSAHVVGGDLVHGSKRSTAPKSYIVQHQVAKVANPNGIPVTRTPIRYERQRDAASTTGPGGYPLTKVTIHSFDQVIRQSPGEVAILPGDIQKAKNHIRNGWAEAFKAEVGERYPEVMGRISGLLGSYGAARGSDTVKRLKDAATDTGAGDHPEFLHFLDYLAGEMDRHRKHARVTERPAKSKSEQLYSGPK